MSNQVKVYKPKPHKAQKEILDNAKRFNVLRNGRRWGKTKLAVRLAMETILAGGAVGYFVPTHEFSEEFWEEIKERLAPIITYKNESHKLVKFATGGRLKLWSLEKKRAGRGKRYNRVIIDEAAFAKDLKESWEKAIRATLADFKGDAWFLSTPNGSTNYFRELCDMSKKHPLTWMEFHMPTSSNPYISQDELDEIKEQFDELTYLQEFEAIFVDFNGKPFAYSFDKKKHVKEFAGPTKKYPLYLSFDFNRDPITCIVSQHNPEKNKIRVHMEYILGDSDIYKLCQRIRVDWEDFDLIVTGDATGTSSTAMVKDNTHYYKIIRKELGLIGSQFKGPRVNPFIHNSRVLTNSILSRHIDIKIHPRCKELILDLQYVEVTETGDINKKKDKRRTHLLDCFRYYLNTFHWDFIKRYVQKIVEIKTETGADHDV